MCINVYVYVYQCGCVYLSMCMRMCMCICMWTCTCMCMHVRMYVRTLRTYVCKYVCAYVRTYECMYVWRKKRNYQLGRCLLLGGLCTRPHMISHMYILSLWYKHMYTCNIHVYVYIYLCMHIYICVYVFNSFIHSGFSLWLSCIVVYWPGNGTIVELLAAGSGYWKEWKRRWFTSIHMQAGNTVHKFTPSISNYPCLDSTHF